MTVLHPLIDEPSTELMCLLLRQLDTCPNRRRVLDQKLGNYQQNPERLNMLLRLIVFVEESIAPETDGCEVKVVGGYGREQPDNCRNVPLLCFGLLSERGNPCSNMGDNAWVARIFFTDIGPRISFPTLPEDISFLNPQAAADVDYGYRYVNGEATDTEKSFSPLDNARFLENPDHYLARRSRPE